MGSNWWVKLTEFILRNTFCKMGIHFGVRKNYQNNYYCWHCYKVIRKEKR